MSIQENAKSSSDKWRGIGKDITEEKRAERFSEAAASLSHGLSGVTSPRQAAHLITDVVNKLIGWDSCSLELYDIETDTVQTILAIDSIDGERMDVTPLASVPPSFRSRSVIEHGPQLTVRTPPLTFEKTAVPFGDISRPSACIMTVPINYGTGVLECFLFRVTSAKLTTRRP
jgi:hypothetical protein